MATEAEVIENVPDGHGRRVVRIRFTFDDGRIVDQGPVYVPESTDVAALASGRIAAMDKARVTSRRRRQVEGFKGRVLGRVQTLIERVEAGETLPGTAFDGLRDRLNELASWTIQNPQDGS